MRFNWDDPCFKWGVDASEENDISYGKWDKSNPFYRPKAFADVVKKVLNDKEGEENMTMLDMDTNFVQRGFGVTRRHESHNNRYEFTITKNGFSVSDVFMYPNSCSEKEKGHRQREFINQLLDKWAIDYDYCTRDAVITKKIRENYRFAIKKVIFNEPATIVLWADGTKTVVKCQEDDIFNPEVGLAMAISKRALGDKGSYCNVFKKWCEPYKEKMKEEAIDMLYPEMIIDDINEEIKKAKVNFLEFIEARIAAKKNKENAGDA